MTFRYLTYFLVCILLATAGCSEEKTTTPNPQSKVVRMGITFRDVVDANATQDELKVSSAYVFIFNNSGLLENVGHTQVQAATDGSLVDHAGRLNGTWTVYAGVKQIYVLLNPHEVQTKTGANFLLDNVANEQDLQSLVTTAGSYALHYASAAVWNGGLCMSGKTSAMVTSANAEIPVSIARRYARVDLRVKKGEGLENSQVKVTGITLKNFADQTPLFIPVAHWTGSSLVSQNERSGLSVDVASGTSYTDIALPVGYIMPQQPTAGTAQSALPQVDIRMENPTGEEHVTIYFSKIQSNGSFDLSQLLNIEANKIYRIEATVGQRTTVEIGVHDWAKEYTDADLSGTKLLVERTETTFFRTDTIHFEANVPPAEMSVTVDLAGAQALGKSYRAFIETVDAVAGKYRLILNDRASVGFPESGDQVQFYATLRAGNISKVITYNQRWTEGTIEWDRESFFISPAHPTVTATLTSSAKWTLPTVPTGIVPAPATGLAGATAVTFRRDSCSGNADCVAKNTLTGAEARIKVCNLFIDAPTTLYLENQTMTKNFPEIQALGGQGKFVAVSYPEWISSVLCEVDGTLSMTWYKEPNEEKRNGLLVLAHVDDPSYQVFIPLAQDIIIRIPEFEYFTLKFTWQNNDVDIAVHFANNGAEFDLKPVGWHMANSIMYNNQTLLQWGGDARVGQGETAFFNAPLLNSSTTLPRNITLQVFATWFTNGRAPDKMSFHTYAYLGGTMVQEGTNFNNIGGSTVYEEHSTVMITTTGGYQTYATGGYTPVAEIVYDRVKHSATIVMLTTPLSLEEERALVTRGPIVDEPEEPKPWYPSTVLNFYSK